MKKHHGFHGFKSVKSVESVAFCFFFLYSIKASRIAFPTRRADPVTRAILPAGSMGLLADLIYLRMKLEMKNHRFAGRSANLRMKYGYHSVPYGT